LINFLQGVDVLRGYKKRAVNNRAFYRHQYFGSALYMLGLGFSIIVVILIAYFLIEDFLLYGSLDMADWRGLLAVALISLFYTAGLIYMIKIGKRRKRLFEKFKQLSDAERLEVNTELSAKFAQYSFGENRLYFHSGLFVHFISYDDISWMFQYNIFVPMIANVGDVILESSFAAASLIIYDRDGNRYKINTGFSIAEVMKLIKERNPDVIFGFSKARLRLAKKDFDMFLLNAKYIR